VKKHLELLDSVENLTTGDRFRTEVTRLRTEDLKTITKKAGWIFDWKKEAKNPEREVFKLTIENNSQIIQGLVSLSVEPDDIILNRSKAPPSTEATKKSTPASPATSPPSPPNCPTSKATKATSPSPQKTSPPKTKKL